MKFLKSKRKIVLIVLLIVAIFFVGSYFFKNGNNETYTVKKQDFVKSVVISGKVIPAEEANLSFEYSGVVDQVKVEAGQKVVRGQILARIDSSEIIDQIRATSASLQSELAKLNSLSPEGKRAELTSILKKSFVIADDVIRNKVDLFIDNSDGRIPEFDIALGDYFLRQNINKARYELNRMFDSWTIVNSELNSENVSVDSAKLYLSNLKSVENILLQISSGTAEFLPYDGKTRAQIDAYIATISQARSTIAGTIIEINQATDALRNIMNDIPVQEASIENARATLSKNNTIVDKYILRAPFDGVVTEKKIEVGETAKIGETVISIMSEGKLELETYVPEVRIAGIEVGNTAKVKMDAFGDDEIFDAVVTHIDPRETEKEGITTYKTSLNFIEVNKYMRSGMTAEIEIEKERINSVIMIPTYLITNGKVSVQNGSTISEKEITIGDKDGKGNVIVEGLNEGDTLVIPK